jgi:hypothetical protein
MTNRELPHAPELCDVHVHQHCPTAAPSGVDADQQAVSDKACIATLGFLRA